MEKPLEKELLKAAKIIEDQVDAEIERIEKLDEDDLENIRRKRLEDMKKGTQQKQEWISQGHGVYFEVTNDKEFFDECKKSKNVVCHFYRDSTFRCKIVDRHLELLASKHLETKFMKINVEKCPFLIKRLHIKVLPTICISKEAKTIDYIIGFDDLGGTDDFSTEMLEWRLGCSEVINYSGDLSAPPTVDKKPKNVLGLARPKKTIRGKEDEDSSDENDW